MTRAEWAMCVAAMNRMWPRFPLEEDTARLWYKALEFREAERVQRAILQLGQKVRLMPSLADLLTECKLVKMPSAPRIGTSGEELLPEGVVALIRSENYQDIAVEGFAPWRLSAYPEIPQDIRITEIRGVPPQDWKEPAA